MTKYFTLFNFHTQQLVQKYSNNENLSIYGTVTLLQHLTTVLTTKPVNEPTVCWDRVMVSPVSDCLRYA